MMDLRCTAGGYEATLDKQELDGHEYWHIEILEDGALVFDFNGSVEECLDYLIKIGRSAGK